MLVPPRPKVALWRATTMHLVITSAGPAHVAGITEIYNHAVEHTLSVWTSTLATVHERQHWVTARQEAGFPVLVALTDSGEVAGYGSYGPFRQFPGYAGTVENSVYVSPDHQGKGIGTLLMNALIDHAHQAGFRVMVAAIESGNTGSLILHERLGFRVVGELPGVGEKWGKPLDLTLMQRELNH